MAFTLEDGSGNPDANAYIDTTFADTYHADRGNSYWTPLATATKQACIIRATDYLDKRFIRRYRGYKMVWNQGLGWPRIGAYDNSRYLLQDVPLQVQKACAEYALRAAIYNVLAPDPIRPVPNQDMSAVDPNSQQADYAGGALKKQTVKVGPIEESNEYESIRDMAAVRASGGSRAEQSAVVNDLYIPQYPEADLIIEEVLESSFSVRLERA